MLPIVAADPYLAPHSDFFHDIHALAEQTEQRLLKGHSSLADFATAHEFFGMHRTDTGWVLREWAPNATAIFLIGPFSNWHKQDRFALHKQGGGIWEIMLPADTLRHQDLYRLLVEWQGGCGERIPPFARRVVQDNHTHIFSAQVWDPPTHFQWQVPTFKPTLPLFIYEAHVGMAQEAERVGTYWEFKEYILPRVIAAGYNCIQLMAVAEHPYYGSFGYQVSSYFAPSSRFGTPEELKELIDTAHAKGLTVLMDIVHSHSVKNEVEGLSRFDGTLYQYFHDGGRGEHPVWDSRLFNYGKDEVLRYLLSNVRYWLEEFKFDGFRFDGVTSMLYYDHGLGRAFTNYDEYFNGGIDHDALVYLTL
ncbi:MAG: 1,4-alpha-glucan-branching enzyme, partial [Deltaproteobacteria bacterium]|nr:1,4-alpha-glucan-branching enzyme [Deltaproteobacteria bacterium]